MSLPLLIGIAGPSGSGKTTLAHALATSLGETSFLYTMDRDYYGGDHLTFEERVRRNYDHPEALELSYTFSVLSALKKGKKDVFLHTYDFARHTRGARERLVIGRLERLLPKESQVVHYPELKYIIVEGMFALLPPFHSLMDVAVFVDTDLEECYRRRLYRDVEERGRTKESVYVQWNRTVVQGYRDFIEPTKEHAHVLLTHQMSLSEQVAAVIAHLTLFERTRVS